MVQDGPPPGGFPSVRIARRIPSTGPGGFTVFAVSAAIMAYGFYLVSACRSGSFSSGYKASVFGGNLPAGAIAP